MVADSMPLADSDSYYYLTNFQTMLDTLETRDGDLLEADERGFIGSFASIPLKARALLVRMVMRKGRLFRASRLVYAEIDALQDAMRPLVALSWVDDRPRLDLEELFRVTTKAELVKVFGLSRRRRNLSKSQLLDELRVDYPQPREFWEWCADSADALFRLTISDLCERLRLMFFGNFRQELTEFVLADLGVFRYERVPLHIGSRPFESRRQVDNFLRLHRCREMLHAGALPGDIESTLPDSEEGSEWLQERREKLRFQVARAHERAGATDRALAIYTTCGYPEAAVRAARLLDRRAGMRRRSMQRASPPRFDLELERSSSGRAVEYLVLEHLVAASQSAESSAVYFVENSLIGSLFGLLCWQAIFAPVPGAFFHDFHRGPADLGSAGFFARRQGQFNACFEELNSDAYRQTIRRHFNSKAGICSPFVAWGLLDETLLETALLCFPARHLRRWFEWIAGDVNANRSGFPDLVQFWPTTARYRLIEVKGPGDRLQDNQRRCLEYCLAHDMPVSVCHVRYSGGDARDSGVA
jgi:hypothetical protein